MDEERLRILKMLAEGKISPEEAAELLEALEEGEEAESGRRARREAAAGGSQVASAREASGSWIGEGWGIDYLVQGVWQFVSDIVERLAPLEIPGPERTEEQAGELVAETVEVDLEVWNGRLTLRGWDRPGYRAVVTRRVRKERPEPSPEELSRLAPLVVEPGRVELKAVGEQELVLCSLDLWLPAGRRYCIRARTGNGRIEVEGLGGPEVRLHTANGRVVLTGGFWEEAALRTGNGRLVVAAGVKRGELQTGNGHAEVTLTAGPVEEVNVATGRGSVTLDIGALAPQGLQLDISSGLGGIRCEVPGLVVEDEVGGRLRGHLPGGQSSAAQALIRVRTGLGPVTVR
ncbi:MAG: hypothetical protein DIU70_010625 [Bacillota bacterium]|nr:MAG: hypothetical protein DIU70_01245 [Bacillota bacterium]